MMGAPQIIYVVLIALSLGIHLARHGEPRNARFSIWSGLVNASASIGLVWWGGFFG